MKHTQVVSTKCTPGFACRAFSDTTLVCFIVNEHTTKCSRYNIRQPGLSSIHECHRHRSRSDFGRNMTDFVIVTLAAVLITSSMFGGDVSSNLDWTQHWPLTYGNKNALSLVKLSLMAHGQAMSCNLELNLTYSFDPLFLLCFLIFLSSLTLIYQ